MFTFPNAKCWLRPNYKENNNNINNFAALVIVIYHHRWAEAPHTFMHTDTSRHGRNYHAYHFVIQINISILSSHAINATKTTTTTTTKKEHSLKIITTTNSVKHLCQPIGYFAYERVCAAETEFSRMCRNEYKFCSLIGLLKTKIKLNLKEDRGRDEPRTFQALKWLYFCLFSCMFHADVSNTSNLKSSRRSQLIWILIDTLKNENQY